MERAPSLPAGQFVLDPARSTFAFRATAFLLMKVTGTIRCSGGTVSVADGKVQAEGIADAASIATGIRARDWHLRHRHYLDAAGHPEIRIVVPPVPVDADGVVITLFARGRSVEVPLQLLELDVTSAGELRAKLGGSFDRSPLGMLPRQAGVSRRVHLDFDLTATPI